MKKALITGITGQDGSYLAEFLIEKGTQIYPLEVKSGWVTKSKSTFSFQESALIKLPLYLTSKFMDFVG